MALWTVNARFISLVFSCRGRDHYQGMKRGPSFVVEGLARLKVRMLLRLRLLRLGLHWLDLVLMRLGLPFRKRLRTLL